MARKIVMLDDLRKSACSVRNPHLFEKKLDQKKPSKYGNNILYTDDGLFHSEGEYSRWVELKLALKTGDIGLLRRQVYFELNRGGTHTFGYVADFDYVDQVTGKHFVEDFKGAPETALFRKKCRLMQKLYGITVKVTRKG
jgi:hypothetical protein